MKKRIMHVVQSPGGVERYLLMLLKNMDKSKYEQIIVGSYDYHKNNYDDLSDVFEQIDMVRNISIRKDTKAIISLRKLLKKYKPDIVYVHSSKAGVIGRIANLGLKNKLLYNPHGWSFNMDCSQKKKTFYKWIEKFLAPITDKIIAISDFEKQSAVENKICKQNKIKVIFNGIDIEEYEKSKSNFKVTRKSLDIPDGAYVIGMVGRLSKQKAPDTFIKAVALIKDDIPEAFFLLVGDGEDKEYIKKLIEEKGLSNCTCITGWVDNPMEYIQLFDQAMLLSRWEGFGLVLTEYMISEKPVIATEVDAIPNIIDDGQNGILVPLDDELSVKKAALTIYSDSNYKDKLVANSKKKVSDRFDIKRVVYEHEILIEDLTKCNYNLNKVEKEMKKLGIVSCYFQKNYGSILQAYATQKYFDEINIENETINISEINKEIISSKIKFYIRNINNQDMFKAKFKSVKHLMQRKLKKHTFGNQITTRNKMFEAFNAQYFKVSKAYASKNELAKECKNYLAIIVGSDQLWTPANIDADYYTLTFVPDNVPRISYATSFGVAELPEYQNEKAKNFLKRIDYVSVRERSGKKIVEQLTNRKCQVVCDPTLLFTAEQWMDIQKNERIIDDKYIFCYFIGNNPEQRAFVEKLKMATGFKIVALQHIDEYIKSDSDFADIAPYDIGPGEFLNLIRNAEYVCTDSFHGSIFSILNRKLFFTFRRFPKSNSASTNTRLDTLLNRLGLEGRLLEANEDISKCMHNVIDYDKVHKELEVFRNESKEFILNALENIERN